MIISIVGAVRGIYFVILLEMEILLAYLYSIIIFNYDVYFLFQLLLALPKPYAMKLPTYIFNAL